MPAWLVLFRGINVGGNNLVPMKKLLEVLETLGAEQVKTYIQSGNVVLEHALSDKQVLGSLLRQKVSTAFGFEANIILLSVADFRRAAQANPFTQAQSDGKTCHLFFLAEPPLRADLAALEAIKKDSESWQIIEQVFYLHAPEGIGRSTLAAKAEKLLGVEATARNSNTVSKLLVMCDEFRPQTPL